MNKPFKLQRLKHLVDANIKTKYFNQSHYIIDKNIWDEILLYIKFIADEYLINHNKLFDSFYIEFLKKDIDFIFEKYQIIYSVITYNNSFNINFANLYLFDGQKTELIYLEEREILKLPKKAQIFSSFYTDEVKDLMRTRRKLKKIKQKISNSEFANRYVNSELINKDIKLLNNQVKDEARKFLGLPKGIL